MDLAKFVWLLAHRALYLPRADLLGDPHEGAIPAANRVARDQHVPEQLRAIEEQVRSMHPQISEHLGQLDELGAGQGPWPPGIDPKAPAEIYVKTAFVSCWNLSPYEHAALWSIYGTGIAIRSTFAQLRDALRTGETVYIGSVNYIDYANDAFPMDNGYHPLLHKRLYFENEHELRAIVPGRTHADPDDQERWTGDPRPGIAVDVDLDQLVSSVHVAPGETMLPDVVQSLCEAFRLAAPVEQSSLDQRPRF